MKKLHLRAIPGSSTKNAHVDFNMSLTTKNVQTLRFTLEASVEMILTTKVIHLLMQINRWSHQPRKFVFWTWRFDTQIECCISLVIIVTINIETSLQMIKTREGKVVVVLYHISTLVVQIHQITTLIIKSIINGIGKIHGISILIILLIVGLLGLIYMESLIDLSCGKQEMIWYSLSHKQDLMQKSKLPQVQDKERLMI